MGLQHVQGFFPPAEANRLASALRTSLPWAPVKWSWGYTLPQHVFEYDAGMRRDGPAVPVLEELVRTVEESFQTQVTHVWANLFRSQDDHIEWHQDKYAQHLFVFSFGAARPVEVRDLDKSHPIQLPIQHGDLYHWTAHFDATHQHRVPKAAKIAAAGGAGWGSLGVAERISVLLLARPPAGSDSEGWVPLTSAVTGICGSEGGGCGARLGEFSYPLLGYPYRKCLAPGCGAKHKLRYKT